MGASILVFPTSKILWHVIINEIGKRPGILENVHMRIVCKDVCIVCNEG